jgi:hypothetical protein
MEDIQRVRAASKNCMSVGVGGNTAALAIGSSSSAAVGSTSDSSTASRTHADQLDETLETSAGGFVDVVDLTDDAGRVAAPTATATKPRRK